MPIGGKKPAKKAQIDELYEQLDNARLAKRAHIQRFKGVYERGSELDQVIASCEAAIKGTLVDEWRGMPSGRKTVYEGSAVLITVTPMNRREFDQERMLKDHRALLEEIGAIIKVPAVKAHEEVDIKVVDNAVRQKTVDKALVDKYIKHGEAMTPAVSFGNPEPKKES